MLFINDYISPVGKILLYASNNGLKGLYFYNQKYFPNISLLDVKHYENEIIYNTKKYLDDYFTGKNTSHNIPIEIEGTEFQKLVWAMLLKIPYGKTTTYYNIAVEVAKIRGLKSAPFQAVGNAIGHNKISILIPCHRVLGKDKTLKGYAAGIQVKKYLLGLEKVENISL